MHTATSNTRKEVLGDIIKVQEELRWYGGGTATTKRCLHWEDGI